MRIALLLLVFLVHLAPFCFSNNGSKLIVKIKQENTKNLSTKSKISLTPVFKEVRNAKAFVNTSSHHKSVLSSYYITDISQKSTVEIKKLKEQGLVDTFFTSHKYPLASFKHAEAENSLQWHISALRIKESWKHAGSRQILVGVIDTGINWEHENLVQKIWINLKEDLNANGTFEPWSSRETRDGKSGDLDGVDNDGNGYVDDIIGYNFVDQVHSNLGDGKDRDNFPWDEQGHGTSVSAVIASNPTSKQEISGVSTSTKIVTLKAFDVTGNGEDDDISAAIVYAANNGVEVLNLSFGDYYYSPIVADAIDYATNMNVVVVASAGNDGVYAPHFPSDYQNVISVGWIDENFKRNNNSQKSDRLSCVAPGSNILTAANDGSLRTVSGTSFSSPIVAGLCAMIKSKNSALSSSQIKYLIESNANNPTGKFWNIEYGSGIVDFNKSLKAPPSGEQSFLHPLIDEIIDVDSIKIIIKSINLVSISESLYIKSEEDSAFRVIPFSRNGNEVTASLHSLSGKNYIVSYETVDAQGITNQLRTRFNRKMIYNDVKASVFSMYQGEYSGIGIKCYSKEHQDVKVILKSLTGTDSLVINEYIRKSSSKLFFASSRLLSQKFKSDGGVLSISITFFTSDLIDTSLMFTYSWYNDNNFPTVGFKRKSYTLPSLYLTFKSTFSQNAFDYLLANPISEGRPLRCYQFFTNRFIEKNTIASNMFVRDIGDFNGDGSIDLLTQSGGNSFVLSRESETDFSFRNSLFKITDGVNWASRFIDVNNDKSMEAAIFENRSDSLSFINGIQTIIPRSDHYRIFTFANNTLIVDTLQNISQPAPNKYSSDISLPGAAVGDFDNDGKQEFAFLDADGDLIVNEFENSKGKSKFLQNNSDLRGPASDLCLEVDVNGDSIPELLVGSMTYNVLDSNNEVEPQFFHFRLLKAQSDSSFSTVWESRFHGAKYGRPYYNGISKGDLNGVVGDEIVLHLFPYTYVFTLDQKAKSLAPLWQINNTYNNSSSIRDWDKNGANEISIVSSFQDSTFFFEQDTAYQTSTRISTPIISLNEIDQSLFEVTATWGSTNVSNQAYTLSLYKKTHGDFELLQAVETQSKQAIVALESNHTYAIVVSAMSGTKTISSPATIFDTYETRVTSVDSVLNGDKYIALKFNNRISSATQEFANVHVSYNGELLQPTSIASINDSTLLIAFNKAFNWKSEEDSITIEVSDFLDVQSFLTPFQRFRIPLINKLPIQTFNVLSIKSLTTNQISVQTSDVINSAYVVKENFRLQPTGSIKSVAQNMQDSTILDFIFDSELPRNSINYVLEFDSTIKSNLNKTINPNHRTVSWSYPIDSTSFSCFPQPLVLKNQDFLTCSGLNFGDKIAIVSLEGASIHSQMCISQRGEIIISTTSLTSGIALGSGVYLLRIERTNGSFSEWQKLIVKE